MRRAEFLSKDWAVLRQHLAEIAFGTLALPTESALPYLIPLSFSYDPPEKFTENNFGTLYFHGAPLGRKFEILKNEPAAAFSAAKNYAYIPSAFLGGTMIPTQFFYSILAEGKIAVVADFAEKERILEHLVKKYEPQNAAFSMAVPPFKNKIKGTFVFKMLISNLTIKAKFGQNMSAKMFAEIQNDLKKRNESGDAETLKMMNYFSKKP